MPRWFIVTSNVEVTGDRGKERAQRAYHPGRPRRLPCWTSPPGSWGKELGPRGLSGSGKRARGHDRTQQAAALTARLKSFPAIPFPLESDHERHDPATEQLGAAGKELEATSVR